MALSGLPDVDPVRTSDFGIPLARSRQTDFLKTFVRLRRPKLFRLSAGPLTGQQVAKAVFRDVDAISPADNVAALSLSACPERAR